MNDDKPKRDAGRPPRPMPEPIDADPEDVARAILTTPPKRRDEWRLHPRRRGGLDTALWPLRYIIPQSSGAHCPDEPSVG